MLYSYILIGIFLISLFIVISHNMANKRINPELKIQQTEHPDLAMISLLLDNKLPTIFLYELELWDGIDLLIGEEYDTINEVVSNKDVIKTLQYYLKPYSLPLSLNWKLSLEKSEKQWEDLDSQPLKQTNTNQYFVNFSGLMMVCLINPSKSNLEILKNEKNIKSILTNEENVNNLEYIIIPVRPSNMIYIPYGWYFWIYNGVADSYCCYLDCNNKTFF